MTACLDVTKKDQINEETEETTAELSNSDDEFLTSEDRSHLKLTWN